ncbi:alpha/beta fold hydrolase [Arthrobacter sp. MSA 4-2]|uniref:alpha/beta fold hydrolase n=1 Tax=Arthrobacter sp. MSA 4-2 TaxID=2794349 RepID=UPI0018E6E4CE|nr:alpha/beta fold hydrolase [Arthrobacter sp. MSA 4-2]MBJ2120026.1 alpha/beta fold hydrolase [Arthrobacter sp. MSA 4-2]
MVALPGVDPSWSAYLDVPSSAPADNPGTIRTWHYLDNAAALRESGTEVRGTLLCVHGNPTWSYLWRTLLPAGTQAGWRVVAVDQLNMGFSQRTGVFRRLADRVTDLEDFAAAADLRGPLVTVGHDWGGVVSLGFAHRNRSRLAGVVLTNTAVHQDPSRPLPAPLRLALLPPVRRTGTQTTTAFLDITHALARPKLAPEVRDAFRAPYRTVESRKGIADFVADIPRDQSHPSFPALTEIAEGIRTLDVPSLLLWGPHDPVFTETYLEDLTRRLPHADVHRFEDAGHLVQEDADVAGTLFSWLRRRDVAADNTGRAGATSDAGKVSGSADAADRAFTPLETRLTEAAAADGSSLAVAEMDAGRVRRSLSWAGLEADIAAVAAGLTRSGLGAGSRISLMVPPGVDLTVLIYACLRIGAVIVVADAGLGARGLSRAVRGSAPDAVIGIERALAAARIFGWPGRRISVEELDPARRRLLAVDTSLAELRTPAGAPAGLRPPPHPDADAAILFTSGSTGPAKGVVYTHRQLSAMRDAVAETFGIHPGGALVAGFAPFALLGPALGVASVTPDMDVTAPRTLTAAALADAVAAVDATAVFASPAALRNVLATETDLSADGRTALQRVGLLLSAGAPIPAPLLERVQALLPDAALHTPYGMTEALPVTDVDLPSIRKAAKDAAAGLPGAGNGVCVGTAVHGARVAVSPLGPDGSADGEPTTEAGVSGEILVDAPHVKDRYHRLWRTEAESARTAPWHRTGDVGHFDAAGRLWVEGRLGHIITAPGGVLTPVGVEHAIEEVDGVRLAAVVGVGPAGTQAVVGVVETDPPVRRNRPGLAEAGLADGVRAAASAAGTKLAAVLTVPALPVDIRHNSKLDRARIAAWAEQTLSGGRVRSP